MRSPFDYGTPGGLYRANCKPSGGGGATQTVTSKNETRLPQWVENAAQDVYNYGQQVSRELMPTYSGDRVAPLSYGQTQGIQSLWDSRGMAAPGFNDAQGGARGVMSFQPGMITPPSGADLDPYMNPYTENVIDRGLGDLDMQRRMGLNQNADAAVRAGAFGGSRHGVTEGVTNAESARAAGDLSAGLRAQNFDQAQLRKMQTDQLNQQAGIQGAGLRLAGSNALGDLAARGQASFLTGTNAAMAGQGALQQQQQALLDAQQQAYGEQRQDPIDRLRIQLSALGGVPYGQTQSGTQTGPGPQSSGLLQGLGAASSVAGIAGSLAPFFMSDEDEKTDKKKLGIDPVTGLALFAYRYKGDPKTYKKVVGPMAQDIEKKFPGTVREIGGRKVIDTAALSEAVGPTAVKNLGFGGG